MSEQIDEEAIENSLPQENPRNVDDLHVDVTALQLPDINLYDAILNRRTCTEFTQEPVEFEKLAQIVQAGMEAPSSGNLQNWQFIVVTEKPLLRELFHHTLEQDVFLNAPVGIIICSDEDLAQKYYGLRGKRLYSVQNCAACIENMLLAAYGFGIGSCWVGAFDEEKVDSMFNIPAHVRAQGIILFGYPNDVQDSKERKRIEHLLYFNKYGNRLKKPHLVYRDYSVEWEKKITELKHKAQEAKNKAGPLQERSQEFIEESKVQAKNSFEAAKIKLDSALKSLKKNPK